MVARNLRFLGSHSSSRRDASWTLVQDEDGTLHVEYENMDDHSDDRRQDLNDFLRDGRGPTGKVLELIGRMFTADAVASEPDAPAARGR